MIDDDFLYKIEESIIEEDIQGLEFLEQLIAQRSGIALWLTSESLELFDNQEYHTLLFVVQVLTKAYKEIVDLKRIDAEKLADKEEELYALKQSKGKDIFVDNIMLHRKKGRQEIVGEYLLEFMEDIEEETQYDKVVIDAIWVSVFTLFLVLESNVVE